MPVTRRYAHRPDRSRVVGRKAMNGLILDNIPSPLGGQPSQVRTQARWSRRQRTLRVDGVEVVRLVTCPLLSFYPLISRDALFMPFDGLSSSHFHCRSISHYRLIFYFMNIVRLHDVVFLFLSCDFSPQVYRRSVVQRCIFLSFVISGNPSPSVV